MENNDKLFEKYTSSSCVYFKNIYYYYYALKGEDILIKPFLKNLFQDTNERLSFVIFSNCEGIRNDKSRNIQQSRQNVCQKNL